MNRLGGVINMNERSHSLINHTSMYLYNIHSFIQIKHDEENVIWKIDKIDNSSGNESMTCKSY